MTRTSPQLLHSPPVLECRSLALCASGPLITLSLLAGESVQLIGYVEEDSRALFDVLSGRRPCVRRADTQLKLAGVNFLGVTAFECSRRGVQLCAEAVRPIPDLTLRHNLQLSGLSGLFSTDEVLAYLPQLREFADRRGELLPLNLRGQFSLARVLVRPTRLLLMSVGTMPEALAAELRDRGVAVIFTDKVEWLASHQTHTCPRADLVAD